MNDTRITIKQDKILKNAVRLFKQNGIRKVTMDEIAAAAGVSKMTVYKYFGTRETLLSYICMQILQRITADMESVRESEAGIIEKMKNCMELLTRFMVENDLDLCLELARYDEGIESRLKEFQETEKSVIISLVGHGKEAGLVRTDVDDEILYRYIDMGLRYFQHDRDYREKMLNDESFREGFMDFIWGNIFIDTGAVSGTGRIS